ncbi:MAG: hypothetical protein AAGA27_01595 [Pseudomonadota bacterium]
MNKHGLDFHDAAFVFDGQTVTFEDDRADYGEKRIISMKKANEREQKIYQKRLKTD